MDYLKCLTGDVHVQEQVGQMKPVTTVDVHSNANGANCRYQQNDAPTQNMNHWSHYQVRNGHLCLIYDGFFLVRLLNHEKRPYFWLTDTKTECLPPIFSAGIKNTHTTTGMIAKSCFFFNAQEEMYSLIIVIISIRCMLLNRSPLFFSRKNAWKHYFHVFYLLVNH